MKTGIIEWVMIGQKQTGTLPGTIDEQVINLLQQARRLLEQQRDQAEVSDDKRNAAVAITKIDEATAWVNTFVFRL